MAAIKVDDLEQLTDEEVRKCYLTDDYNDLPTFLKEYVLMDNPQGGNINSRMFRLHNLLKQVIVRRWLANGEENEDR